MTPMHYFLVSRKMCTTHVSSPLMIRSRNSLPSPWYRCRNVNADSMCFALCSRVSCIGNHLAYNFLNNSDNFVQQGAGNDCLLPTILHNAFPHKSQKVVRNDRWPPTALLIMPMMSTCCKLSALVSHHLL